MQTNITFYQLDTCNQTNINRLICQLTSSYYSQNRKVYIFCSDEAYCHQLDEFLIEYLRNDFFPYQLHGEGPIPPAPVCIGSTSSPNLKYDILINLHSSIPADFRKYREIIEFVPEAEDLRILAREHYKHYNKFNCSIRFSKLNQELSIT